MYDGAIFDLDDTLVESEKIRLGTYRTAIKEVCGKDISLDFQDLIGRPASDNFRWLLGDDFSGSLEPLIIFRNELLIKAAKSGFKAIRSTNFILQNLIKFGVPVAVASNSDKSYVKAALANIGFGSLVFVSGDMVQNLKPAPDLFIAAAEKIGLPLSNCLVFEDSPAGLRAASTAGMASVAVLGFFNDNDLVGTKSVIRRSSLTDAKKILFDEFGVGSDD